MQSGSLLGGEVAIYFFGVLFILNRTGVRAFIWLVFLLPPFRAGIRNKGRYIATTFGRMLKHLNTKLFSEHGNTFAEVTQILGLVSHGNGFSVVKTFVGDQAEEIHDKSFLRFRIEGAVSA